MSAVAMRRPHMNRAARPLKFIGAAIGLGAPDDGCAEAPERLRALCRDKIPRLAWQTTVHASTGAETATTAAARFCRRLAREVDDAARLDEVFAVVGGDHSCAIGTWSGAHLALRHEGPLGLLWIDAHMDAHTPVTSPSGRLHGMPLACLLGQGEPALVHLSAPGAKLRGAHVALVGVRSFEPTEAELLARLGVRVILMEEVQRRGLDAVLDEALARVTRGTAGFGVSIDLDAVDPIDAPAVATPVPGGLSGKELVRAVVRLRAEAACVGFEIAEFNPRLDHDGITMRLVAQLLGALAAPGGAP